MRTGTVGVCGAEGGRVWVYKGLWRGVGEPLFSPCQKGILVSCTWAVGLAVAVYAVKTESEIRFK